jgi:hypothetical protein
MNVIWIDLIKELGTNLTVNQMVFVVSVAGLVIAGMAIYAAIISVKTLAKRDSSFGSVDVVGADAAQDETRSNVLGLPRVAGNP